MEFVASMPQITMTLTKWCDPKHGSDRELFSGNSGKKENKTSNNNKNDQKKAATTTNCLSC